MVYSKKNSIIELNFSQMILYFRVKIERRIKKINYSVFRINVFSFYYRIKNKISIKHFYSTLYSVVKNRVILDML